MSQPHQMATMGGPVGGGHQGQQHPMNAGTPNSGSGPPAIDAVKRLNTAIYDYLLRNALYDTARSFVNSPHMDVETGVKKSPSSDSRQSQQQANGVGGGGDEMEIDNDGIKNRPGDLPAPLQLGDGPFLQDWWCQFWEIFQGYRNKGKQHTLQYIGVQRQAQKARTNAMVDPQGAMRQQAFNGAGQMIGGGGMNGDLKRVAMQNPRNMTQQQLQQMQRMQNQGAMQGQTMERQGSQMDMARSGSSPNSGEAPSPKRQRLEGNMQMQPRPGPTPMPQGNQQVGPLLSSPTPTLNSTILPNIPQLADAPHPTALPREPAQLAQTYALLRQNGVDPAKIPQQQVYNLAMQPANHQQKSVEAYSSSLKRSMTAAMHQASSTTQNQQSNSNVTKGMPPQPQPQQLPNQLPQGMPPQGQPGQQPMPGQGMPQGMQVGSDGQSVQDFYNAQNGGRPLQMGAAAAQQQAVAQAQGQNSNGNHALQDYQMQLMLLEQQNKKRLLMARQEQDSMTHPGGSVPPQVPNGQGGQQFVGAPGMSPQGSRAGDPSPNPNDMMGRGTPKIGKAGMSPNGADMAGRGSPGPGMMDPNLVPPQLRQQMMQSANGQPMMRPPSSHPGAMGQPMSAEQMQLMRPGGGMPQQLPNGQWSQAGPGQGQPMMPGQPPQGPQQGGPPNMTPRQGNQPMPPPPPPNAGQGPGGTQPSSPAQGGQAPPTPNQNAKSKAGAKKDGKKGAAKKGGNPGATPVSETEAPPTPTPATPITPMHQNSFNHNQNKALANGSNNQPQPAQNQSNGPNAQHAQQQHAQHQQQQPPQPPQQQQQQPPQPDMPFGNLADESLGGMNGMNLDYGLDGPDMLDNFNFDEFLNAGEEGGGLGGFDANFAFDGTGLEAGLGEGMTGNP